MTQTQSHRSVYQSKYKVPSQKNESNASFITCTPSLVRPFGCNLVLFLVPSCPERLYSHARATQSEATSLLPNQKQCSFPYTHSLGPQFNSTHHSLNQLSLDLNKWTPIATASLALHGTASFIRHLPHPSHPHPRLY